MVRQLEKKLIDLEERKTNLEINKVIYKEMTHGIRVRTSKIREVKNVTAREVRRVFMEQIRDCQLKGEIELK